MDLIFIIIGALAAACVFFIGATVGYLQGIRELSSDGKAHEFDFTALLNEDDQSLPAATPAKRRRGRPAKTSKGS